MHACMCECCTCQPKSQSQAYQCGQVLLPCRDETVCRQFLAVATSGCALKHDPSQVQDISPPSCLPAVFFLPSSLLLLTHWSVPAGLACCPPALNSFCGQLMHCVLTAGTPLHRHARSCVMAMVAQATLAAAWQAAAHCAAASQAAASLSCRPPLVQLVLRQALPPPVQQRSCQTVQGMRAVPGRMQGCAGRAWRGSGAATSAAAQLSALSMVAPSGQTLQRCCSCMCCRQPSAGVGAPGQQEVAQAAQIRGCAGRSRPAKEPLCGCLEGRQLDAVLLLAQQAQHLRTAHPCLPRACGVSACPNCEPASPYLSATRPGRRSCWAAACAACSSRVAQCRLADGRLLLLLLLLSGAYGVAAAHLGEGGPQGPRGRALQRGQRVQRRAGARGCTLVLAHRCGQRWLEQGLEHLCAHAPLSVGQLHASRGVQQHNPRCGCRFRVALHSIIWQPDGSDLRAA